MKKVAVLGTFLLLLCTGCSSKDATTTPNKHANAEETLTSYVMIGTVRNVWDRYGTFLVTVEANDGKLVILYLSDPPPVWPGMLAELHYMHCESKNDFFGSNCKHWGVGYDRLDFVRRIKK